MKTIYKSIQDRITNQVPGIIVDLDYGQADNYELRPNLKTPAALLKISISPEAVGGGSQLKNATVGVRLVFQPLVRRTGSNAPETAQDKSLAYLDTADGVYLALQGWQTDDFEALECNAMTQEDRSDGLLIISFTLSTSFFDFRPETQA